MCRLFVVKCQAHRASPSERHADEILRISACYTAIPQYCAVMPREIIVDWTTPSGSGKASVLYFLTATSVASQRAALSTFIEAIQAVQSSQCAYTIRTVGRELSDATGALTGAWSEPTAYTGTGNLAQEPLPDASQALIRWSTNHIVGSRFLQGRTFIPCLTTNGVDDGNVLAATRTTIQNAANALVAAAVQFAIWHRPVGGAGGVAWAVDVAAAQSEFAVLRRRRG
jgi:hypothetical protein